MKKEILEFIKSRSPSSVTSKNIKNHFNKLYSSTSIDSTIYFLTKENKVLKLERGLFKYNEESSVNKVGKISKKEKIVTLNTNTIIIPFKSLKIEGNTLIITY